MKLTDVPVGVRDDLLAACSIAGVGSEPARKHTDESALADMLYTTWYCGVTASAHAQPGASRQPALPSLPSRLRAAHAATGRFEPGWIVQSIATGGQALLVRGSEQLALVPPDYVNLARPAVPARTGDSVAVTRRRDGIDAENAWWFTASAAGDPTPGRMIRVYWNCPVELVEELVHRVTDALEPLNLPYSMKCPLQAELYERRDPVVVYVGLETWTEVTHLLRAVHESVTDRLRDPVPPLTLRLGHGVAAAQDPGNERSFGQSRAYAIAEGIVSADDATRVDQTSLLALILEHLSAHDICPQRPYLSLASPAETLSGWSDNS